MTRKSAKLEPPTPSSNKTKKSTQPQRLRPSTPKDRTLEPLWRFPKIRGLNIEPSSRALVVRTLPKRAFDSWKPPELSMLNTNSLRPSPPPGSAVPPQKNYCPHYPARLDNEPNSKRTTRKVPYCPPGIRDPRKHGFLAFEPECRILMSMWFLGTPTGCILTDVEPNVLEAAAGSTVVGLFCGGSRSPRRIQKMDPPKGSIIFTIGVLDSQIGGSTFWILLRGVWEGTRLFGFRSREGCQQSFVCFRSHGAVHDVYNA